MNILTNNFGHFANTYVVCLSHFLQLKKYRSPEEFAARDLNEQIDVFSFGNNIYALLTGLWVFYENEDDGVVQVCCALNTKNGIAYVCRMNC